MFFIGQQSVVSSLTARWGSLIPVHVCVPPRGGLYLGWRTGLYGGAIYALVL